MMTGIDWCILDQGTDVPEAMQTDEGRKKLVLSDLCGSSRGNLDLHCSGS